MKSQRFVIVFTLINCGILLFVLFAFVAQTTPTVAQDVAPTLRARSLELVDEKGTIRAKINVESDGATVLRLVDEEGNIRVKLGASEDGSGLVLMNHLTEAGVHILTKSTGTTLTLTSADGQQRVIVP